MTTSNPPAPPVRRRLLTWRLVALGVLWLLSMVVAAQAFAFFLEKRVPILRRLGMLETTGILQTNLYPVRFQRLPIAIDGRYGAITALRDGVLFSSRSGRLWYVDSTRTARELALRVPINVGEFDQDPYNANTVDKDHFAVKDLLVQSTSTGIRLFASHNQWDSVQKCYWLRLSEVELTVDGLLAGEAATWTTRFDSRPCLPLSDHGGGTRIPTIGSGGRIEALSAREILLTVGMFIPDGDAMADTAGSVRADRDYGKTFVVDLVDGRSRQFTRGHRNPQGLAIGLDGRIWSTEHAQRGGDELNLLRDGTDYGYPLVSYGTAYGSFDRPPSPVPGMHERFEKPRFAWVPSIGVSQLIVVRGSAFARWRGDLFVSSLAARSVFRIRLDGDRVVLVEPITTIHRFRDIVETTRGEIVLLAEDGFLFYMEPASADGAGASDDPVERGRIIAGQCQGCHTLEAGGASAIGPNLFGVFNRRVAGGGEFRYSPSLSAAGGVWTEERLRAFVRDPQGFAPGTSMSPLPELSEQHVEDVIAYLRTLR